MQFKHPELLWALLLLVIPLLVHLFQLRKFRKIPFTNVAFLKKISIQTRKSSQLKKWLVLFCRMGLLASLIFAFAQPYTGVPADEATENSVVIYLDNSFSMQLPDENGSELLTTAVNQLIGTYPEDVPVVVFTNEETYRGNDISAIQNELIDLPYSQKQLSPEAIKLKAQSLYSQEKDRKRVVLISDFQNKHGEKNRFNDSLASTSFIRMIPANRNNISIDSVYIKQRTPENISLAVQLTGTGENPGLTPISLYNGDQLIAKNGIDMSERLTAETTFIIPVSEEFKGKVLIEDSGLKYDNELFFSFSSPETIHVTAISEKDSVSFLSRIFTADEFSFTRVQPGKIDFDELSRQDLIILNEPEQISVALRNRLVELKENGASVVIIPSVNPDLPSYNALLTELGLPVFDNKGQTVKVITSIAYDHPLFDGVFDERTDNFEYPEVSISYTLSASAITALDFSDRSPFLVSDERSYLFTAPLNQENSNFQRSPLVVPVFYNMGIQSIQLPRLYYLTGRQNTFDVATTLEEDQILSMQSDQASFIPLQQSFSNKVTVITEERPESDGHFYVTSDDQPLQTISYNFPRDESILEYSDADALISQSVETSVAGVFTQLQYDYREGALWKWFVIFALIFLATEMLVLKFYK
ncbi:BatA domain-containing protein [Robertkochia aurantiaca]|uniref:BatA domain-containing protein n=1 Tax=Robertkochia aurantiaca TaxID=2873700 RepID=UPI001CD00C4A|nr:BatA domain-containing protein [Robertkochia sp. 3YJGBD-33]